MGWNDHLEDDNELGNLPSEAFSPWNVDGPFEPQDHWLRTASEDEQKIAMRAWFLGRYCDPAENTPYNGKEGGYQFVYGGPYDPADVLPDRFARAVNDAVIQTVIDEFQQQVGDEWAPVQQSDPEEYDQDYGVNVEDRDQPLTRLRDRLAQSKEVLSLQGNFSAKLLARNLAFGSVITSLESFLWETVLYWVENDDDAVRNIVTKIPYFRDQPLKLGQVFEKRESLRNDIKAYLQNLVWHRWSRVAPLFTSGLGLKFLVSSNSTLRS